MQPDETDDIRELEDQEELEASKESPQSSLRESKLIQGPVFRSLPANELGKLFKRLKPVKINEGEILFKEGDEGDMVYIIVEGELEIIQDMGKPEERLLGVSRSGNFVGEMSLFAPAGIRTATARGHKTAKLVEMTIADFEELLENSPILGMKVLRELGERLRNNNDVLQQKNLELASAYEKLVSLNTAYERFIPKEFISFLDRESIVDVQLGDQVKKEMTIMFSDIRGFTALSEAMEPQESFNFLNEYLGVINPIIHQHEGFINRYMGDGVIALFANKASDALLAAVEMEQAVNKKYQKKVKGKFDFKIGIGLHSGDLMLGILGGESRMQGSVISDSVNLTSRIEGLNKIYGSSIMISETAFQNLDDSSKFASRFIDKVRVQGKSKPISVYEIFEGNLPDIKELKLETKKDFEKGLKFYYQRNFAEASVQFKRVLNKNETDLTARKYLERSAHLMLQDLPEDWDGVENLKTK